MELTVNFPVILLKTKILIFSIKLVLGRLHKDRQLTCGISLRFGPKNIHKLIRINL